MFKSSQSEFICPTCGKGRVRWQGAAQSTCSACGGKVVALTGSAIYPYRGHLLLPMDNGWVIAKRLDEESLDDRRRVLRQHRRLSAGA
jgi:hypothetical protein